MIDWLIDWLWWRRFTGIMVIENQWWCWKDCWLAMSETTGRTILVILVRITCPRRIWGSWDQWFWRGSRNDPKIIQSKRWHQWPERFLNLETSSSMVSPLSSISSPFGLASIILSFLPCNMYNHQIWLNNYLHSCVPKWASYFDVVLIFIQINFLLSNYRERYW